MTKKLRIFYGFDTNLAKAFKIEGKDTWMANIHDTLQSMGHELIPFDYDLGVFYESRKNNS